MSYSRLVAHEEVEDELYGAGAHERVLGGYGTCPSLMTLPGTGIARQGQG